MASPTPSGSVGEVFRAALGLGLTSFGGPIAHIGYFRREYVERRGWLDDRAFAEYLALSQALPGPTSSQLGIAIGARRAGALGGAAAWLGFTLPSALLLVAFAVVASAADIASAGWVHGLKLAAVVIVAQAVYLLARALAPDLPRKLIALAAAAVALAWTDPVAQITIIGGGAVAGLALAQPDAAAAAPDAPAGAVSPVTRVGARRVAVVALASFAILLALTPVARTVAVEPAIAMLAALYRAGALVFGGGHVVLPLLDAGVVQPGWVPENQFLAGYGAAQAVPGPLFSFASFLGFVGSPLGGAGGAAAALLAIYLPSFLLLIGVLPFWDRLRASPHVRRGLSGVNAAVVGLLAAALYTPVWTGAVSSGRDVAIVGAGLIILTIGRAPPIVVVLLCAVAAQLAAV